MPTVVNGQGTYLAETVTPTISAGAYAADDVVGGLLTFRINSAARGGKVKSVVLLDKADVKATLTLYLFRSAPASIADNAAFALSDDDLPKVVAKVVIDTYADLPSNAFAIEDAGDAPFVGETLYGYLVCTATPTYGSTSALSVRLNIRN